MVQYYVNIKKKKKEWISRKMLQITKTAMYQSYKSSINQMKKLDWKAIGPLSNARKKKLFRIPLFFESLDIPYKKPFDFPTSLLIRLIVLSDTPLSSYSTPICRTSQIYCTARRNLLNILE